MQIYKLKFIIQNFCSFFYNFGNSQMLGIRMNTTFTIGDTVMVLDDSLEGKVVGFNKDHYIKIETTEGFILEYKPNEIIKISNEETQIQFNQSVSQVLAEKEPTKKKKSPLIKPSKKDQMVFEVDLHLEKIISGKNHNLTNFDKLTIQLDEAKRAIDFAINKRYQRVVLIHGVGEGVLKSEIEYLLKRYDNLVVQEANYSRYGLGAMEIYIKQN